MQNTKNNNSTEMNSFFTEIKNNYFTEMFSGSEEGSYSRLIDFCIHQLDSRGGSRRRARSSAGPPSSMDRSARSCELGGETHTHATRIGWHLWEIDLRFAPELPPGWCQIKWLPPLEQPDEPEEHRHVCEKEHVHLHQWVCAAHPLSQRLGTPVKERICIELTTSDRQLKASREGSK